MQVKKLQNHKAVQYTCKPICYKIINKTVHHTCRLNRCKSFQTQLQSLKEDSLLQNFYIKFSGLVMKMHHKLMFSVYNLLYKFRDQIYLVLDQDLNAWTFLVILKVIMYSVHYLPSYLITLTLPT